MESDGVLPDVDANGPYLYCPDCHVPDYVLTKTHCRGYFQSSSPKEVYIYTVDHFDIGCRTAKTKQNKKVVYTPTTVPVKAVHLIRNPFDNMVARMHHDSHKKPSTNGKVDFDAWCEVMDQRWNSKDVAFFPDSIIELFQSVPCYADWFRYVQWHNNANEVIRQRRLPVLVLMYEDYTTNYNRTVDSLFDFLNLEKKGKTLPFVAGKKYPSYYSEEVSFAASRLVQAVATPQTWDQIKHYFEERWI
jgi:hypothetical protein